MRRRTDRPRPPGGRIGRRRASRTLALVGPCASMLATCGSLTNCVDDLGGFLRAEEDIEVADRLGASPEAAAILRPDDLPGPADGLDDRRDQPQGVVLEDAHPRTSRRTRSLRGSSLGLSPKPLSAAIRPDSAAVRRSARLTIFNSSWRALIFFGPSPGLETGTSPGAFFDAARRRRGAVRSSPVARSWRASSRRCRGPRGGRRRSSPARRRVGSEGLRAVW